MVSRAMGGGVAGEEEARLGREGEGQQGEPCLPHTTNHTHMPHSTATPPTTQKDHPPLHLPEVVEAHAAVGPDERLAEARRPKGERGGVLAGVAADWVGGEVGLGWGCVCSEVG